MAIHGVEEHLTLSTEDVSRDSPDSLRYAPTRRSLVPKPPVNLIRYHGIFAPNKCPARGSQPAGRGRHQTSGTRAPAELRAAMTSAQRLKRVFNIDVEICEHCGAPLKIIAGIEDPAVIRRILEHLERRGAEQRSPHPARAPPRSSSVRPMNEFECPL